MGLESLPQHWHQSTLFRDGRRNPLWWKVADNWAELKRLMLADMSEVEYWTKRGFELVQRANAHNSAHYQWKNRHKQKLKRVNQAILRLRRRQVFLWRMVAEADAARRRGAVALDQYELSKLASRMAKVNLGHSRRLNDARWKQAWKGARVPTE